LPYTYVVNKYVTRNIEHHIERHYEIESNKDYLLQQLELEEEFYEDRLQHCLRITESLEFSEILLDHYGEHEAIDDFNFLKERSFKDFFKDESIDVPRCFRNTLSVRRSINQVDLLKLNNYLMRDGKRLKVFNQLARSIWTTHDLLLKSHFTSTDHLVNWKHLFTTFSSVTTSSNTRYHEFPFPQEEETPYGHTIIPTGKYIEDVWNFNKMVFQNIYRMLPLFSFYVYKVDKKIYKNTRGKSGKYTFIWKYVASYKRIFLVMHWLLKELRVKPGRSLINRLDATMQTLVQNPQTTWVWKVRKFSHSYVYKNARRTLAETYRTTTK